MTGAAALGSDLHGGGSLKTNSQSHGGNWKSPFFLVMQLPRALGCIVFLLVLHFLLPWHVSQVITGSNLISNEL